MGNATARDKAAVVLSLAITQVVMEYCGGGNAWDIVDDTAFDVREEHVATILKAVLKALKFLEENGILHRDIKVQYTTLL